MYEPCRLIGLELGILVLSGALRGKPTGQPQSWRGDVVAVAERDLSAGGTLDGEGGYTVWGKIASAEHSLAHGAPADQARQPCRIAALHRGRHDRVLGRRRDAGQQGACGAAGYGAAFCGASFRNSGAIGSCRWNSGNSDEPA